MSDEDRLEVERRAIPGAGSCGGMYTANTMASVAEALGMSLPGSSTMAAVDDEKALSTAESARVLMAAIEAQHLNVAYVAIAKSLDLPTQAYMALSDGKLVLRDMTKMVCIEVAER